MHYQLYAGFAEVYVASLDTSAAAAADLAASSAVELLSGLVARRSVRGLYVRATSARSRVVGLRRRTGRESRVPVSFLLDGHTAGPRMPDRSWSAVRTTDVFIRSSARPAASELWPVGSSAVRPGDRRASSTRQASASCLRCAKGPKAAHYRLQRPGDRGRGAPVVDGRSVISQDKDGRVTLHDTATGRSWTWEDSGVERLRGHLVAPHTGAVAYVADERTSVARLRRYALGWLGRAARNAARS